MTEEELPFALRVISLVAELPTPYAVELCPKRGGHELVHILKHGQLVYTCRGLFKGSHYVKKFARGEISHKSKCSLCGRLYGT